MKISEQGRDALAWMVRNGTARMWSPSKAHPTPFEGGFTRSTLDALKRRRLAVCLQDRPLVMPWIVESRCDVYAATVEGIDWMRDHYRAATAEGRRVLADSDRERGVARLRARAHAWFRRAA